MTNARCITVTRRSVDGYQEERCYKSLAAAQKWAQDYVGEHPDKTDNYAVSFDGICIVRIEGATLGEIFPEATGTDDKAAARKAAKAERQRRRREAKKATVQVATETEVRTHPCGCAWGSHHFFTCPNQK